MLNYGNMSNKEIIRVQTEKANRLLSGLGIGDIITVPPYENQPGERITGTIEAFYQHQIKLKLSDGSSFFVPYNDFKVKNIEVVYEAPDKLFSEMYENIMKM